MNKTITRKIRELKKGEKVPLMFDEAAKIMFANPERLEPLTLLLSNILQVDYKLLDGNITLVPTTLPNDTLAYKKTDRDIVVYINYEIRNKIIIEVNISKYFYETILNKSLYYFYEVSGKGLKETEKYDKIEPTFLVCFNTFYVDDLHKKTLDYYYWKNDEGYILTKKQKILQINIEDCYMRWYNGTYKPLTNIYEKDLLLLGAAMYTNKVDEFNKCIKELSTSNNIKKILEGVSTRMNENDELKVRYYDFLEETRRLNDSIISDEKRKAHALGKEEGISQGILQNQKEIITNMINIGVSKHDISKYLNLTIDEINNIIGNDKEN